MSMPRFRRELRTLNEWIGGWLFRGLLAAIAALLVLRSCKEGPDYPQDWPKLQTSNAKQGADACPDLSGMYEIPKSGNAPTRGSNPKKGFEFVGNFLGVRGQGKSGMPTRMQLIGPNRDGLQVTFFDRKEQVVRDEMLAAGKDYVCRDQWIVDGRQDHTRAKPPYYYAKDVEGRLIGHKAFSAWGVVPLLGFIPIPAYVDDHEWWRIESVGEAR